MHRLSPRQLQAVAGLICGSEHGDSLVAYRTGAEIDQFINFTGIAFVPPEGGTRFSRACAFVEAAQALDDPGPSELAKNLEKVLVALLDRREFDSDEACEAALV